MSAGDVIDLDWTNAAAIRGEGSVHGVGTGY
jgi:hypothetical protein